MSATNRGAVRRESDFYATPLESIYSFLDNYCDIKPTDHILEPSAGNGAVLNALRTRGFHNKITAVELREEEKDLYFFADEVIYCDFLTMETDRRYDVIIGNPPYSLAQEFIDKSLSLLSPGGRLIFLLRTNFLESEKRFKWWQDKIPSGLYTLHKRPSFTGKGTDATSYSWFVWKRQTDGQTDGQTDRQTDRQ
jgi:tRNA1(Val) A37 N6-methylase TrmN6